MSRIPMGKVLLRNVIRHTDAHNKIQEESEMWKLRDMERQAPGDQVMLHRRTPAHMHRGHMHCDRFLEESSGSTRDRSEEQETRYWTQKLYDFEASDPNRWGHSGFKELYPEEFETDGMECSNGKNLQLRKERCKVGLGRERHKHSKKSSRKKKKKKEKKKRKAEEEEKEEEGGRGDRSSSSSSQRSAGDRHRQRRKASKSKHRRKKKERRRREESSSGDSNSEGGGERQARRPRKRCSKAPSDSESHAPDEPHRKKRKDWKATKEENSEESTED